MYSLWLPPPPPPPAADAGQFGAGRAAELFQQPAQPGAALRALEQFDRVDPELLEQVVERLGAVRGA